MNIYLVISSLFVVGYLCKYPLANHFSKKEAGILTKRIANKSMATVLKQISEYALFAAKTYLALVLLLGLIRLFGKGMSADGFEHLQQTIASFASKIESVSGLIGLCILGAAILTILILLYKKSKQIFFNDAQVQFAGLVGHYNHGSLPALPPTNEMNEVQIKIEEVYNWVSAQEESLIDQEPEIRNAYVEKGKAAINDLSQFYARLDIERRINLQEIEEAQKSLKGRMIGFITSKGFFESGGKVKGVLGNILSAVALIALLVVQVGHSTYALSNDMSLDVMQKRIQEAQQSFAYSEGMSKVVLSEADEKLLDEMAADFELAVGNNPVWASDEDGSDDEKAASAFLLESLLTRETILNHFSSTIGERSNSTDFGTYKSISDDQFHEVEGYRQTLIRRSLKDLSDKNSLSELGKEYRTILKERIAQANPAQWEKIKAKFIVYKQSFKQPVSFSSVTGKLWSNVTGDIPGNLARFGDNELGKAANEIVEEIGKEHLKMIHENIIYKHISSVCSPTPYADSWNDLKNMSPTGIFPNQKLAEKIKNKLPMLDGAEIKLMAENMSPGLKHNSMPVNLSKAEATLSKIETDGGPLGREALQTFDDYFPAQNSEFVKPAYETKPFASRSAASTARASMSQTRSAGGMAEGLAQGAGEFFKVSRARSVKALRGFSRIGGVLIGDLPHTATESNNNVSINGITWKSDHTGVTFTFKNKGEEVKYGPYEKDIVLSALVYAADGRPTTVTMVKAAPLTSLKILLHPALVNSQLGLDAIELDRWVDTYQSQEIGRERTFVMLCQSLYILAHYYRLGLVEGDKGLAFYKEKFQKTIKACEENFSLIRGRTLDKYNCPFYAKAEFYEQELVEVIKSCMDKKPINMAQLNTLIISKVKERWEGKVQLSTGDNLLVDHNEAPKNASSYQVWSGVREVGYSLSSPLVITPVAERPSINYPFDFIIQTAFTSSTVKQSLSSTPEEYIDASPWQFPGLEQKDVVNKSISEALRLTSNRQMQHVYSRMSQFTELQRLFRLAFEGQLGKGFPLHKLITLVKEFDKVVPYVKTPEWNYNPYDGLRGMLDEDYKALADAVNLGK
jgi:hypothetical protein